MKKNIINHWRSLLTVTLLLVVFGVQNSCNKSSDSSYMSMSSPGPTNTPTPPANEVWIQNMAFTPTTITVMVNTTVKWTNKDGVAHTVTSDTGLFDSGSVGSNGTFSYQFMTAGTYHYHCTIHPYMTATVIVQ